MSLFTSRSKLFDLSKIDKKASRARHAVNQRYSENFDFFLGFFFGTSTLSILTRLVVRIGSGGGMFRLEQF